MLKKAVIIRIQENNNQTLGRFFLFDGLDIIFEAVTLELPYKFNYRNVSCVPEKLYKVVPRTSKKYGKHFILNNVFSRDLILIHSGNFYTQTKGCILLGKDFFDINSDGEYDITSSRDTVAELVEYCQDGFDLNIIKNV